MAHSPNIILSADDFGKSNIANQNILSLLDSEFLDRVSVMINGQISEAEIKKLIKSNVKLDIHLELPQNHIASEGLIVRSTLFIWRFVAGNTSAKKVRNEWEKQIEKFKKMFGKTPDGLNSHEHVHFFPPYLKIALKLCEKYKIPYIRFGKKGILANNNNISWTLKILNRFNKNIFEAYNTGTKSGACLQHATCDYLVSLDWIKNFAKSIDSLVKQESDNKKTIEIVCHPEREEEYKTIKNLN